MHHKFIPTLIGLCIIGGTFGVAYWQHAGQSGVSSPQPQASSAEKSFTAADVAAHDTSSDCWAIINGGVYDLTSWIPRHPGGERAIEGLCGKDGSAAFNSQHGGGAAQEAILTDLKIGTLAQ